MYSNSRNDVPRVAQRYGTIAAHTLRRASVLIVFVVFCVHMHSFAGLIRADATPDVQWHCNHRPPLWYHYFPAQSSLVRISWSIGSEKQPKEEWEWKFTQMSWVTWPTWLPCPYMVKNFKKIFFSRTNRPMTLKLSMKHCVCKYYQDWSNYDPGLTLTHFTPRSNLVT